MKTAFLSIVLIGLAFCASAQISTNQPSRFKTKVVSYDGKIGSGAYNSTVTFLPENPGTYNSDAITSPGKESELKWSFVGRNGGKDVYHFTFTRMTRAGSSDKTTTSKEIQFDGKQIIVFEDDLHTVVMENPSADDLKSAQKR